MMRTAPLQNSPAAESSPATADAAIDPLNVIRVFRSAGKSLFAHVGLQLKLAQVEWSEEKSRLAKMLASALFGFACLLCGLIFVGIAVLAVTWDTAYRVPAAAGLVVLYVIGAGLAWRRLHGLSTLSGQAFAATREELAADLALLRSKL